MLDKLKQVEERYEDAERRLADPEVSSNPKELQRLGKTRSDLEPVVTAYREYRQANEELAEAKAMVEDPEMREMALDEIARQREKIEALEASLKAMLLPKDPNDEKNVILEIRSGVGGDEAAIFAADMYKMYARYAERKGWKYDLVEWEESPKGGASRVTMNIEGKGAFSQLKHESGVHRVQRVPATESSGRTHTSAASVVVLPEAEDVEIDIRPEDLEWDSFRASSAGGQHMQKNETAIRVTHKPSGIIVACQDERSQVQNKNKAMKVLRAKLYEREMEAQMATAKDTRAKAYRSGDRSEKIRTYNWPQNRVTDHRVNLSINNLSGIMDGDIQAFCDALIADEQARRLAAEGED